MTNGAGHSHRGIVRGCPLGTGRDCCEWHGSGTADEDDVRAFLATHGIGYIYADAAHPNSLVPDAIPVFSSDGLTIYRIE